MQLEEEIYNYRAHTFSDNTKTTYRTHCNSYLRFCARMGYATFPAQTAHICQYAAYLAHTLNPSSIPGYLNIIALLHKEFNLPNPPTNNWQLKSLLTGIKRIKGVPPSQKLPITPEILFRIHSQLNLRTSFDASFWAICPVSFFGILRKSHLLNKSACTFKPDQQLRRSDFQFCPWGILILVCWSKTIQFREKIVQLPLPYIPGSPLCPATAVQRVLSFTHSATPESQAFMWYGLVMQKLTPFTYSQYSQANYEAKKIQEGKFISKN